MLLVPSVEVEKGEPQPFWLTLHMGKLMVGGLVAVMPRVDSVLLLGASLLARKATYVPWLVRYVVAAWMISLFETCDDVTGALIPPRLSRLSKYALPSLPNATMR
jgi:hypothetical protein